MGGGGVVSLLHDIYNTMLMLNSKIKRPGPKVGSVDGGPNFACKT